MKLTTHLHLVSRGGMSGSIFSHMPSTMFTQNLELLVLALIVISTSVVVLEN